MRKTWIVLPAAALAAGLILPAAGSVTPASAAARQTSLSLSLSDAAGNAPMAGARVVVFLVRPAPRLHARVSLPRLAAGVANSSGKITLALNTSVLKPSDLGDSLAGGDTFNTLIFAWNQAGYYSITNQIAAEKQALPVHLRAGTDPATGRPSRWPAARVKAMDKFFSKSDKPAEQTAIGDEYRYSPITPLTSAPGLHTVLAYTFTSSVTRQSDFSLATTASGAWGLSGNQQEQTDRSVSTGITVPVKGGYHRWAWADYYFVEYAIAVVHGGYVEWEPDHFQGTVADYNPNKKKVNGVKTIIGHLNWKMPAFQRGPGGNWEVKITPDSLPFARSMGTREENAVGFNFSVGTEAVHAQTLMTYGSITTVTWSYRKGVCPKGYTRVIYAYHTDPVAAGRDEAGCERNRLVG
jgi:hypothetical protein